MEKVILLFHRISMVKYPLMILGIFYIYKPILFESVHKFTDINTGLILISFGIGLDSLKDYNKLNWIDKKVYHNPPIAKIFFLVLGVLITGICIGSLFIYRTSGDGGIRELSMGFFTLGVSALGVLKAGMESTKDFLKTNTN